MSYDISKLAAELEADRNGRAPDLAWILASTRDPKAFFDDLVLSLGSPAAPRPQSRYGERFDLYHDLVIRHLGAGDRPALRYFDRTRSLQSLSYGELDARATRKAGEWSAQKAAPGDVVAIVLHPGPAWLVAILAALRLGLCFSLLTPEGDRFLARRLDALKAKWIATDPAYHPLLVGYEKLFLNDDPAAPAHRDRPYTYGPGEACASLFSPRQDPPSKPIPLLADTAFLSALRDAVFAHQLAPGDTLAAPGFFPMQHQPALVFTALVAGGTFLELREDDIEDDPTLLAQTPLRSLGVKGSVRDLLLGQGRNARPDTFHWWRSLDEPFDSEAYRRFVDDLGLGKTLASSLLVEPIAGGCILQSVRRRSADFRAIPSPGQPYVLADPLTGKPSTSGNGLFTFAPPGQEKPKTPGHVMVSESGTELAFGGPLMPRREGRVYPADEVVEVVSTLPFCKGAFVIPLAKTGAAPRSLFSLCVFTGAESLEEHDEKTADRAAEIERVIMTRLGKDLLPDRQEFFPLYPRLAKGKLDVAWCETQYQTGLLAKKARDPLFLSLTALRGRCVVEEAGSQA